jgi:hypothetical protein
MALSATKMKEAVIDAMNNKKPDMAVAANKTFGDAVLKNIIDTIEVTYAWAGTNEATGVTDPVIVFTAKVSGNGTLAPSDSVPEMLIKLSTLIKGLTIEAPESFTVSPLKFNPSGLLVAVMAGEKLQDLAMTNLCTQIVASMKVVFINPTPVSGKHGVFTGATAGMVIA